MAYLDDYEEKEKKGLPIKRILVVLVGVVVLGIVIFAVANMLLNRPQEERPADDDTTTAVIVDDNGGSTETVSDRQETIETVEEPVDEPEEPEDIQEPSAAEAYDRPEYKSSAIPIEEKMKMIEDNDIDAETEQKYSQYGALNIDQMRDVATRWTNEWTAMVNDGRWDEHSTVLKSMMDIDYVNNHSTDFETKWLYECLHDTLYVSSESMLFKDIKEVYIVNSVPSPLTHLTIHVNVDYQGVDGATPGTVIYKMALNRNYQVSQFHVAY